MKLREMTRLEKSEDKWKLFIAAAIFLAGTIGSFYVVGFVEMLGDINNTEGLPKFPGFDECVKSVASGGNALKLYLALAGTATFFAVGSLFWKNKYEADMYQVTERIAIPKPVGEKQHGSAWFISDKEKAEKFQKLEVDTGQSVVADCVSFGKTLRKKDEAFRDKPRVKAPPEVAEIKKEVVGEDDILRFYDDILDEYGGFKRRYKECVKEYEVLNELAAKTAQLSGDLAALTKRQNEIETRIDLCKRLDSNFEESQKVAGEWLDYREQMLVNGDFELLFSQRITSEMIDEERLKRIDISAKIAAITSGDDAEELLEGLGKSTRRFEELRVYKGCSEAMSQHHKQKMILLRELYKLDCPAESENHEAVNNASPSKPRKLANVPFAKAGIVVGTDKMKILQSGGYRTMYTVAGDLHTLVVGKTGSGKTRGLVLQSICTMALAGESVVVSDPKGEIYAYQKEFLEHLGYKVYAVDFQNPQKSHRINPLQNIIDAVNDGDMDKAAKGTMELASILVPKSSHGEPIWSNGERSVIGMAILAVVVDNKNRPEFQNLTNVYHFISQMGRDIPKPDGKGVYKPITDYEKRMPDNHPAKELLGIAQIAPDKTAGSFYTSALTTLNLYTLKMMYDVTHESEFSLDLVGRERTAVFFIVPDQDTTYYPTVSMLVSQQYLALVNYAKAHGNRLKQRVNYVLDEFGNFPEIPDFESKLTVARGYGIRFNMFLQGFSQLEKQLQKEGAAVVKGNASVWVYIQSNDDETRETISKSMGEYTTASYSGSASYQGSRTSSTSSSRSQNIHSRRLLTPDEIKGIERPYQLVLADCPPAVMYAPDLSKWVFNDLLGLGDEEHCRLRLGRVLNDRTDRNAGEIRYWQPLR
jgi:type IV secretion system protein VirD4